MLQKECTSCFLIQMLHHVPPRVSKAIVSEHRTDAVTNRSNTFFLPISQAPSVDPVRTLHCLHRLRCIPAARERHAELLPVMRTGFAGWGGIEILSPNVPPDLPLLFMCGNGLFGASLTDTRTEQPPETLCVIGNVPRMWCHCQREGLGQGLG